MSFYFRTKNFLDLTFLEKCEHLYKTCKLWMQTYTKLWAMNNSVYIQEQSYHYVCLASCFPDLPYTFQALPTLNQPFLSFFICFARVLFQKWGAVCTKIEGAYRMKPFCFEERDYTVSKKYLETLNIFIVMTAFFQFDSLDWKAYLNLLSVLTYWGLILPMPDTMHIGKITSVLYKHQLGLSWLYRGSCAAKQNESVTTAEHSFFSHSFNPKTGEVCLSKLL